MWILLAITGHVLQAAAFISDKALATRILPNPKSLAFMAGITNILAFVIVPWFLVSAPVGVLFAGVLGGFLYPVALIFFFYAMSKTEASRAVPLMGGAQAALTLLFGYLILASTPKGNLMTAFILLTAGSFLIEYRAVAHFVKERRILAAEVAAAFFFALSSVLEKYAFNGTALISAFLLSRIGSVLAALVLLLLPSTKKGLREVFSKRGQQFSILYILANIAAVLSTLAVLGAVALGDVTIVSALQGIQFVVLFILTIVFTRKWPRIFREPLGRKTVIEKTAATFIIGAGLYFLFR